MTTPHLLLIFKEPCTLQSSDDGTARAQQSHDKETTVRLSSITNHADRQFHKSGPRNRTLEAHLSTIGARLMNTCMFVRF